MQIDCYTDAEPLPGTPNFYFARETRFESEDTLLLKVYARGATPEAWQRETRLLSWLRWPTLHLVNAGHDAKHGFDYCCMVVPGRFVPLSFEGQDTTATVSLLRAIASVIETLIGRGVAYRNYAPSALGVLNKEPLLYDFSRATRYAPDRIVLPPPGVEDFDPPEARRGHYDAVSAEIYGLGCLFRYAGVVDRAMTALIARMTSHDPTSRPSTVASVVREMDTWFA